MDSIFRIINPRILNILNRSDRINIIFRHLIMTAGGVFPQKQKSGL